MKLLLQAWLGALAWLALASAVAAAPAPDAPQVLVMLRAAPEHVLPNASYGGAYGDPIGRRARHRVAAGLARRHGLVLVDDWPMPLLGVDCFIMSVPAGHSADDEAAALGRDPEVAWAQASHLYRAQGGAGDPLLPTQPAARSWRLADLHQEISGA